MRSIYPLMALIIAFLLSSCQTTPPSKIFLGMPYDQAQKALQNAQAQEVQMAMVLSPEEKSKGHQLKNFQRKDWVITLIIATKEGKKVIQTMTICRNAHLPKSQRSHKEITNLDLNN